MTQAFAIHRIGVVEPIGTVAALGVVQACQLARTMWGGAFVAVPALGLTVPEAVADEKDRELSGTLRIMRAIFGPRYGA